MKEQGAKAGGGMDKKKIGVFVGSLRKESFNRKMAKALIKMAPDSLELEIVEIGGLPMYNQDTDDDPPPIFVDFRKRLKSYDGFLFVTPEYNRSIPAVLKNALDIGSRPYGKNAWDGRPGAVVSVSIGAIGGFGANHHVRQALVFLNVPAMPQPEAYIGNATQLFDGNNGLADETTQEFMAQFMREFERWVLAHS